MLTGPTAMARYMKPSEPTATAPETTAHATSPAWKAGAPCRSTTGTSTTKPTSIEMASTTGTRSERLATPPA